MLLSGICCLVSVGRPFWREDGSTICSVITLWSKVEVTLRLTVCQSVCLGVEHPCGTYEQTLLPVGMLLSGSCCLVSVGRPFWREDWIYNLQCNHSMVEGRSYFTIDRQSVSQYVLLSSTLVRLATKYYTSKSCCLGFAVLFLWGALSDERTGLQFKV
jgi:hypothetical protein